MTDLDKMARELLADQYERDLPGSGIAKKLRGEFTGLLRVADIIALAAIRDALLTAPPGWKLVPVEPTMEMQEAGEERASVWQDVWECGNVYRAMLAAAPEVK
jgi:hypothetical protein